jgi:hypothetical protein
MTVGSLCLHRTILTSPSVHQLLPSYACITSGTSLEYLIDQSESPLSQSMRRDTPQFYGDLESAEAAAPSTGSRRHIIVGTGQPTSASAALLNGRYEFSDLLADRNLAGDGTVSAASGPKGIALDDNSIRRIADKHANLECNNAALDEVESVVSSDPIVVKGGSTAEFAITAVN